MGNICHFSINEWQVITKYKHERGIKKIYCEPYGMSLAFVDDKNDGFIFNPINSNIMRIPDLPANVQGIIWETDETEKVVCTNFKVVCC